MNARPWLIVLFLVPSLFMAGCGKKEAAGTGTDHSEHTEGGDGKTADVVAFKEGRGLELSPAIIQALGLTTTDVVERPIAHEAHLTAQVFATQPRILASVHVPTGQADALENSAFVDARLVQIDRSAATATRQVDLILELEPGNSRAVGDFVAISLAAPPKRVLAVPSSAILEAASGTFVYVLNAGAYLRTPVRSGIRSKEFVEIGDGLFDGDVVVVTPVEQLWLAELRLTKGGGHSH
jgi:multidrug efflux pump subunit AcrA (membrane-fusion protein)